MFITLSITFKISHLLPLFFPFLPLFARSEHRKDRRWWTSAQYIVGALFTRRSSECVSARRNETSKFILKREEYGGGIFQGTFCLREIRVSNVFMYYWETLTADDGISLEILCSSLNISFVEIAFFGRLWIIRWARWMASVFRNR